MKCATRKKHLIIENRKPQRDNVDGDDDSTSLSFSEEGEILASWRELAGAFLIQLTVSSIGYSYGTIFAFSGDGDSYSDKKSLLISSVYITIWAFADPWCRKSFLLKQTYTRVLTGIGVLIAAGGIACNSTAKHTFLQILGYGVVTGLGTSLVVAQTDELLRCRYSARHGLVTTFNNVGKALGSSSMPLASCALLAAYGYKGCSVLIAGIVMQGLIGVALLFPAPIVSTSIRKHQRIPRSYTLINNHDQWRDNSHCLSMQQARNWRNPCRDDLHSSSRDDSGISAKVESFKSPTSRRKQPPIIEVMPKIVEENEDIEEQNYDRINTQEMACVVQIEHEKIDSDEAEQVATASSEGTDLSSSIDSQNHHPSILGAESMTPESKITSNSTEDLEDNDTFTEKDNIQTGVQNFDTTSFEEIPLETSNSSTEIVRNSSSDMACAKNQENKYEKCSNETVPLNSSLSQPNQSKTTKWCCCCFETKSTNKTGSSRIYNKSFRKSLDSLRNTMKTPYFWPVLFLTSSLKLCPILFATLIPPLSLMRVPNCTLEAATFGVSVAGFSWLCLLVLTPWFNSIAPIKRMYVSSAGCFLAAIGLYLLSGADSRDSVTLGCAVFGIGHGIAINTAPMLIDETLGPWNLANVAITLGTLSGSFILMSTILLYFILASPGGLQFCFFVLTAIQALPGFAWLSQPIIKNIYSYLCN